MASLLAVDLGVRTGLACWGDDGRLRWYRSQNFGDAARLRRAIPALLEAEGLVPPAETDLFGHPQPPRGVPKRAAHADLRELG